MVEGDGFEPSKAEPADLQSAPFGHSGTPPNFSTILTTITIKWERMVPTTGIELVTY
ncbi:hypothetical protein VVDAL79087_03298 [Vibrio vulnificus]|nr:hypothetical protein VV99743_03008 [Vibrio vulnificus]OJI37995.1 hypothetical protein VVDAL79087_03298 [Vibrio vulnificus]